ncbi:MAG: hypothetical protein HC869_10170 [Rhodospirillales bacterium]|nr:hypothetical protein [Rhodospirillales bacterium]
MNQAEFERRAAEILDSLFEQIEEQLGDWLDVEMSGGILQIELPDGGAYVVNKHAPNREIWLSSPKSRRLAPSPQCKPGPIMASGVRPAARRN